jgi:hypothetical protein
MLPFILEDKMKKKKVVVIEEINFASGTEMMKASQMRPTTFKDKSKYTRKEKHKNRQSNRSGDCFLSIFMGQNFVLSQWKVVK